MAQKENDTLVKEGDLQLQRFTLLKNLVGLNRRCFEHKSLRFAVHQGSVSAYQISGGLFQRPLFLPYSGGENSGILYGIRPFSDVGNLGRNIHPVILCAYTARCYGLPLGLHLSQLNLKISQNGFVFCQLFTAPIAAGEDTSGRSGQHSGGLCRNRF